MSHSQCPNNVPRAVSRNLTALQPLERAADVVFVSHQRLADGWITLNRQTVPPLSTSGTFVPCPVVDTSHSWPPWTETEAVVDTCCCRGSSSTSINNLAANVLGDHFEKLRLKALWETDSYKEFGWNLLYCPGEEHQLDADA